MDEIEDLLPELEKVWPSWSSDDETFWNHEWTRHGTCAEGVVGQQHAFFKAVLSLHNKLNIQVRNDSVRQQQQLGTCPEDSCAAQKCSKCVLQGPSGIVHTDYVCMHTATRCESCSLLVGKQHPTPA